MNEIAKLTRHLAESEKMLDDFQATLKIEPGNLAVELSAATVEKHIGDLRTQLKLEKERREKEVIELRLVGDAAQNGSISLSLLSDLSKHFSAAIYSASYKAAKGNSPKGMIPKAISSTLNLRLSALATGSTKLYLTGDSAPDLFGFSLLEDSLEKFFGLVNSTGPEELTESVSKVGTRSAREINKLLKTLNAADMEMDVRWKKPSEEHVEWRGDRDAIIAMTNSLASIEDESPEYVKIGGELVMASLKSKFEILNNDGTTYSGTYPLELLDSMKGLHIGDKVKGIVEKKTIKNRITGQRKIYNTLLKIEKTEN